MVQLSIDCALVKRAFFIRRIYIVAEKSNSMNTICIFLDYLLLYLNTSVYAPHLFSIFIIRNF